MYRWTLCDVNTLISDNKGTFRDLYLGSTHVRDFLQFFQVLLDFSGSAVPAGAG